MSDIALALQAIFHAESTLLVSAQLGAFLFYFVIPRVFPQS